jgi:hypothetical protein
LFAKQVFNGCAATKESLNKKWKKENMIWYDIFCTNITRV